MKLTIYGVRDDGTCVPIGSAERQGAYLMEFKNDEWMGKPFALMTSRLLDRFEDAKLPGPPPDREDFKVWAKMKKRTGTAAQHPIMGGYVYEDDLILLLLRTVPETFPVYKKRMMGFRKYRPSKRWKKSKRRHRRI